MGVFLVLVMFFILHGSYIYTTHTSSIFSDIKNEDGKISTEQVQELWEPPKAKWMVLKKNYSIENLLFLFYVIENISERTTGLYPNRQNIFTW